jgi:asparagine synthase (glutamine-hydrolysing)
MVRHQDEPIADAVCVPVYYLSKLARDTGVKVCQLGEGADELFCGYPHWLHSLDMQRASDLVPIAWPKKAAANLMGIHPRARYSERLEWLRRAGSGQPIFWGGTEAFTEVEKKELLHPRLRRQLARFSSHEAIGPIRKRFEERCWEKSPLHWMSYLDLNLRLPELLLMRVDKMTMATSLEARVPFLDHVFVKLAMSIPAEMKTRNRVLKYILKKAVRGVVPEKLITRKKQGFGVPVAEWLLGELGSRARSVLRGFCLETDFLEESAVMRCIEERRANQTWYLLNFALWWNQYIAEEPVAGGVGGGVKWSS